MDEVQTDPRLNAFSLFVVANARLMTKLSEEVERGGGMALDVYDVLVTLESAPDHRLKLSDLADRIVLSRSGLTRRVDRLEGLGYLRREACPRDRRSIYAVLTEEGLAAREQAWPAFRSAIRAYFGDRMTEGEAKQMAAVMRRVIEPLEKSCATRSEETP